MSEDRLDGYLAILSEYKPDDVVEAIKRSVKGSDTFPAPSKIIAHITAIAQARVMAQDQGEHIMDHADREAVNDLLDDFKKRMRWE